MSPVQGKQAMGFFLLALLSMLTFAGSAMGDTTTGLTASGSTNDSANWGQLGSPGTAVSSPFSLTSANGLDITGTFSGSGLLGQQGSGANDFLGNFSPGDNLILVRADSLTLLFSQGISSVGAQIASNFYGPFTGTITAYDGGTLLGSYTENGNSTNSNDGTAIFLGFADLSAPDITSVVFTYTAGAPQGFILDTLQMNDPLPTVITPEPGTLRLALFGFVGLMLWRRRTLPN
jgi:hypothetical protein